MRKTPAVVRGRTIGNKRTKPNHELTPNRTQTYRCPTTSTNLRIPLAALTTPNPVTHTQVIQQTLFNMAMDPQLLTGLGCAASIFLCAAGSAYASSHSSVYAIRGSDYRYFAPIIISGVLAIYGIIVSVLLVGKFNDNMTQVEGYRNLSAGLSVGLACLASGFGMATFIKEINIHHPPTTGGPPPTYGSENEPLVGQRGVLTRPHPVNFIYLCLCLTFLEAIGLYGLIVALFLIGW